MCLNAACETLYKSEYHVRDGSNGDDLKFCKLNVLKIDDAGHIHKNTNAFGRGLKIVDKAIDFWRLMHSHECGRLI